MASTQTQSQSELLQALMQQSAINDLANGTNKGGRNSNIQSSSSSSSNFSAGGDEALAILIKQLLSGGTAEQKAGTAARQAEIASAREQRGDYTKEAAFNDSQLVINQQQRKALEQALPSLVRSAEGAGTSQNALRALLIQDAANKAAESSAALGLKASVDYGNISANLTGVLEQLTRQDNPVTKALLDAINLSKGQSSNSVTYKTENINNGGSRMANTSGASSNWGPVDSINRRDTSLSGVAAEQRGTNGNAQAYLDNAPDVYKSGQTDFFANLTF
jgi:hypothetical protein